MGKKLYFQTNPPGLSLNLDGFNIQTPTNSSGPLEVVSWINHNISLLIKDQGDMIFDSWNNGMKSRSGKFMVREEDDDVDTTKIKVRTARFHSSRMDNSTTTTTTTTTSSLVLPAHRRTTHLRSARIKSTTTTTTTTIGTTTP